MWVGLVLFSLALRSKPGPRSGAVMCQTPAHHKEGLPDVFQGRLGGFWSRGLFPIPGGVRGGAGWPLVKDVVRGTPALNREVHNEVSTASSGPRYGQLLSKTEGEARQLRGVEGTGRP